MAGLKDQSTPKYEDATGPDGFPVRFDEDGGEYVYSFENDEWFKRDRDVGAAEVGARSYAQNAKDILQAGDDLLDYTPARFLPEAAREFMPTRALQTGIDYLTGGDAENERALLGGAAHEANYGAAVAGALASEGAAGIALGPGGAIGLAGEIALESQRSETAGEFIANVGATVIPGAIANRGVNIAGKTQRIFDGVKGENAARAGAEDAIRQQRPGQTNPNNFGARVGAEFNDLKDQATGKSSRAANEPYAGNPDYADKSTIVTRARGVGAEGVEQGGRQFSPYVHGDMVLADDELVGFESISPDQMRWLRSTGDDAELRTRLEEYETSDLGREAKQKTSREMSDALAAQVGIDGPLNSKNLEIARKNTGEAMNAAIDEMDLKAANESPEVFEMAQKFQAEYKNRKTDRQYMNRAINKIEGADDGVRTREALAQIQEEIDKVDGDPAHVKLTRDLKAMKEQVFKAMVEGNNPDNIEAYRAAQRNYAIVKKLQEPGMLSNHGGANWRRLHNMMSRKFGPYGTGTATDDTSRLINTARILSDRIETGSQTARKSSFIKKAAGAASRVVGGP